MFLRVWCWVLLFSLYFGPIADNYHHTWPRVYDIFLAGFLKTLSPNWTFWVQQFFFWPKISKVASASIAFFSSPTFPLLARSFSPFLLLRWSFFGLKDLLFDSISLKVLQISLGWFSKIRLDIYVWLDFLKHGYKIFLIYLSTEYFGGGIFFFIVTFYLFNFYQIFTEYTAVDTLLWVSHWLLTSPPPRPKKNRFINFP